MYKQSISISDGPSLTALKTVLDTEQNKSVVQLSDIETADFHMEAMTNSYSGEHSLGH